MKSEWNQWSPTTMLANTEDCESSRVQYGKVYTPVHRICLHIHSQRWIPQVKRQMPQSNHPVIQMLPSKLMILLKAAGDDVWSLCELVRDRGGWTCHVMPLSFESVHCNFLFAENATWRIAWLKVQEPWCPFIWDQPVHWGLGVTAPSRV